ncbi:MAG TPA: putative toxin-antitoxin system toxin component, PIN family [Thermomicrobiales bacterium]|nr:putative toxin-antitoxin system toxin component, PIN family [Thermomicrobiales bacterium]
MRVVLDTNVIVSAVLSPTGTPARILAAWRREVFELLVSGPILDEYQQTLGYGRLRARHHLTDDEIAEVVAEFRTLATFVSAANGVVPGDDVADLDDAMFLACAIAGGATYIVSGDAHLLDLREYQGIKILPPTLFLALLQTEHSG